MQEMSKTIGNSEAVRAVALPPGAGIAALYPGSNLAYAYAVALPTAGARQMDMPALARSSALRLFCMPALAFVTAFLFGLQGHEALILVTFSAVPAAPTAYILTRQLGGDGPLMAGIITSQTLVAVLSLPIVLYVFGNL